MLTIGRIPKKVKSFFQPVKRQVTDHVYGYFWGWVLALCVSHGSAIERLVKQLQGSTHRTNHGEFLWRSQWDESWVLQVIALDTRPIQKSIYKSILSNSSLFKIKQPIDNTILTGRQGILYSVTEKHYRA